MNVLKFIRNSMEVLAFTGLCFLTTLFFTVTGSISEDFKIDLITVEPLGSEYVFILTYLLGVFAYSLLSVSSRFSNKGDRYLFHKITNPTLIKKLTAYSFFKLLSVALFSLAIFLLYTAGK